MNHYKVLSNLNLYDELLSNLNLYETLGLTKTCKFEWS